MWKYYYYYYYYVVRSDGLNMRHMFEIGNGRKGRGRPRRRWMEEVVKISGVRIEQLKEVIQDRVEWRDVVRPSESSPGDVCVPMK